MALSFPAIGLLPYTAFEFKPLISFIKVMQLKRPALYVTFYLQSLQVTVKGQQTGTSSVSLKKKKAAKSQPSSTKMKPERKRKTSDAAALMISSLTLKLKAKFKQYTLSSAENSSAGNDADGNDGTTVEDGQKEGATIECFSCNLCQVRLKSARRMVKHVRTHEVPDEKVVDTVCVGKFNQEFEVSRVDRFTEGREEMRTGFQNVQTWLSSR